MASVEAKLVRSHDTTTGGGPSADDIRTALARLLNQPPLARSKQLTAFLTYVVETSLTGRAATIKSYTIACDALGRDSSFDPQVDPIVRVEAGRLRRILDNYYAGDGVNDPIRIAIPRGRYIPVFTANLPVVAPMAVPASPPSAVPIVIGIAAVFGAAVGLLISDIGTIERITLIAALLMGLHALIGGGRLGPDASATRRSRYGDFARDDHRVDDRVTARAVAPVRRIAASGGAPRR
jgi:hypothetical protein